MTQHVTPRAAALHLWNMGLNITAIPAGGKEPDHDWNNKQAPWASMRQPREFINSLKWRDKKEFWNGRQYLPIETVGIIEGVSEGDAKPRTFDVDPAKNDQGDKIPVPPAVRETLLRALGLPLDYEWCGPSRSGCGLHVRVLCAGNLPEDIAAAVKQAEAGRASESGVKVGDPIESYAGMFDHVELRWERCQTILPSPTGYNGHLPDEPMALVTIEQLIAAFRAIAVPRQRRKPERTTPTATKQSASAPGDLPDVIGTFNDRFSCDEIIERNGYSPLDDGWVHPQSSQPHVVGVRRAGQDKVQSFSATDPLNDGHNHDAFDCFRILEHNGDGKAAWKAAAAILGIAQRKEKSPRTKKAAASLNAAIGISSGDERTTSERLVALLASWGYSFALNEMDGLVLVNGKPLDDLIEAEIRTRLRDADLWGMIEAAADAYFVEAARNHFHPIRDCLEKLEWDGTDYIGKLASHLHHDMPPVVYPDGGQSDPAHVYLARFLIGAVARIFAGEQNMMLVFNGAHGIGKSELVKWLCSILDAYFYEAPIHPEDKDHLRRLMTTFIWEVSELDATTRKADIAALKAFITLREVRVRHPYARRDTIRPSLASFVGTVNPSNGGFLAEPEDRRFLVLDIASIDWGYTAIDIRQLWAQAVALHRSGELARLDQAERSYQIEANENHRVESILSCQLDRYFDITGDVHDFCTTTDIVDHLKDKGIELSSGNRSASMDLAAALQALKVRRGREFGTRGARGYVGIRPHYDPT